MSASSLITCVNCNFGFSVLNLQPALGTLWYGILNAAGKKLSSFALKAPKKYYMPNGGARAGVISVVVSLPK
ncbi:hypothetical protein H5410_008736 [Solanum commersonii]|uniref:Uncharacterized protein n=1 Tax=Solanum commersonii TaxID=4109 RepID=A0A9J6AFS6_SOLCO|nr:hypothetical protein H5410_008736 [Solanum commersonii]